MLTEIITNDDLRQFKIELINDMRLLLIEQAERNNKKKWLRTGEVKKLLQISASTLQNLRINGTLSYSKVGGSFFYSAMEIDKIIQANQINLQGKTADVSTL